MRSITYYLKDGINKIYWELLAYLLGTSWGLFYVTASYVLCKIICKTFLGTLKELHESFVRIPRNFLGTL
jgi:hypothetical protein